MSATRPAITLAVHAEPWTHKRASVGSRPDASRTLHARELSLLATIATGVTMAAAAQKLGVSDRTIRRRMRIVCESIGVSTPIEAVAWAARRRLI